MGLTDFKFGYGGAVQGFQVGGGTEALAHFVGDGTQDLGDKLGAGHHTSSLIEGIDK